MKPAPRGMIPRQRRPPGALTANLAASGRRIQPRQPSVFFTYISESLRLLPPNKRRTKRQKRFCFLMAQEQRRRAGRTEESPHVRRSGKQQGNGAVTVPTEWDGTDMVGINGLFKLKLRLRLGSSSSCKGHTALISHHRQQLTQSPVC